MPSLKALKGPHKGAVFLLVPGRNTLGRDPSSTIYLSGNSVSANHAQITLSEGEARLLDAGSKNGIVVNDKRIEEMVVTPGDRIVIGPNVLEFSDLPVEQQPRSDPLETVKVSLTSTELERLVSSPESCAENQTGPMGPEALYHLARILVRAETTQDLLDNSMRHCLGHLCATSAFVCLTARPAQGFKIVWEYPESAHDPPKSLSVIKKVAENRGALLLDEALERGVVEETSSVMLLKKQSAIYTPLNGRGVVGFARDIESPFAPTDLHFASLSADLIGMALTSLESVEIARSESEAFAEVLKGQFNIIGQSEAMRSVFDTVARVAATDTPVLVCGETGTGKELVARAIHANSSRASRSFIAQNCAAIPDTLMESALFGHIKGAFTGAEKGRKGCFERADGGTLFLDEVAELAPAAQAQLLRVVEDGVITRVGSDEDRSVDVRLVVATHRDLEKEVREHRFREDLYFRLNVVMLTLPPLRERIADIPLLAGHFLERSMTKAQRVIDGFSEEALDLLRRYPWPGNVRELQNAVARAVVLGRGRLLEPSDLGLTSEDSSMSGQPFCDKSLEDIERDHILRVLQALGWRKGEAAKALGIDRKTLAHKCKVYGLSKEV